MRIMIYCHCLYQLSILSNFRFSSELSFTWYDGTIRNLEWAPVYLPGKLQLEGTKRVIELLPPGRQRRISTVFLNFTAST